MFEIAGEKKPQVNRGASKNAQKPTQGQFCS